MEERIVVEIVGITPSHIKVNTGISTIEFYRNKTIQSLKVGDKLVVGSKKNELPVRLYTYKSMGINTSSISEFYYRIDPKVVIIAGTSFEAYIRKNKIKKILKDLENEKA